MVAEQIPFPVDIAILVCDLNVPTLPPLSFAEQTTANLLWYSRVGFLTPHLIAPTGGDIDTWETHCNRGTSYCLYVDGA